MLTNDDAIVISVSVEKGESLKLQAAIRQMRKKRLWKATSVLIGNTMPNLHNITIVLLPEIHVSMLLCSKEIKKSNHNNVQTSESPQAKSTNLSWKYIARDPIKEITRKLSS